MQRPATATQGAEFDLGQIADELEQEPAYKRDGHTARTLIRAPDMRVVLVALNAGQTMSRHTARVTASVHAITGRILLQLPNRSVDLLPGHVLVLGSGLPHDVRAETRSTFLLTLGWNGQLTPGDQ